MKNFENIEKYQFELYNLNKFKEQQDRVAKHQLEAQNTLINLEKMTSKEISLTAEAYKNSLKEKQFVNAKNYLMKIDEYKKFASNIKILNNQMVKLNNLNSQNKILNKSIEERLSRMATRELESKNFITKKIAQMNNLIEKKFLLKEMNDRNKNLEKIQYQKTKYNELAKQYADGKLDFELQKNKKDKIIENQKSKKDKIIGNQKSNFNLQQKDYSNDFVIKQKLTHTEYKSKTSPIKVKDYGGWISITGGTEEQRAKVMIDMAINKGWDLDKLKLKGSDSFKNYCFKEIQRAKEREAARMQYQKPKENNESIAKKNFQNLDKINEKNRNISEVKSQVETKKTNTNSIQR